MAWIVTRLSVNHSFSAGVEPTEARLVTTFLVHNDDPAYNGTADDARNVFTEIASATPPFNSIKGIGVRMATAAESIGSAQLIVTDLDIRPVEGRANTWSVTQTARAPLVAIAPYRGLKVTQQSRNRQVQQYIKPVNSFPVNGNTTWPPATLITNGVVTNVVGNPVTYLVPQEMIHLEFLVHDPATLGYTNLPTNSLQHINKRNTTSFQGYSAGTVLFQSYERRYVTDQVSMDSYTLVFDPWYHLEQALLRNPADGSVWNDTTIALGGSTVRASSKVVWFQPYEDTVEFNTAGNLFPTEVLAGLTTIQPQWV